MDRIVQRWGSARGGGSVGACLRRQYLVLGPPVTHTLGFLATMREATFFLPP